MAQDVWTQGGGPESGRRASRRPRGTAQGWHAQGTLRRPSPRTTFARFLRTSHGTIGPGLVKKAGFLAIGHELDR